MIIEFEPNTVLLSYPPKWWLYYKEDHEVYFHKISITKEKLILFLEKYGYETNDLMRLKKFGVDVSNIKQNNILNSK